MAALVAKYLDPAAYAVVNGAVEETQALLNLRWDHILFTGGISVGKVVAAAAARHLTPVTLELGGKSPVFVDATADLALAAKRIMFGKILVSGQVSCVTQRASCAAFIDGRHVRFASRPIMSSSSEECMSLSSTSLKSSSKRGGQMAPSIQTAIGGGCLMRSI